MPLLRLPRLRLLPRLPHVRLYSAPPPPALTPERYNTLANNTLDTLFDTLEVLAEDRPELDVEYAAGVLTLKHPNGTYVLNKQPPNRQIWLSSPVSGPKRFDWDQVRDEWVYARDGATLRGILKEEVGVEGETEGGS